MQTDLHMRRVIHSYSSALELSFHRPIPHSSCNNTDPATKVFAYAQAAVLLWAPQSCCSVPQTFAPIVTKLQQFKDDTSAALAVLEACQVLAWHVLHALLECSCLSLG